MRSNKKILSVLLAITIASVSLVGCGSFDQSATIATIGGEEIEAGVINFYARYQQAFSETYYGMYYGEDMWTMDMGDGLTFEDTSKESIMATIQELYVIKQHAEELEIALTQEEQESVEAAAKALVEANKAEINEVISATEENIVEVLTLLTLQAKAEPIIKADVDTEVSKEESNQKKMTLVTFPFSYETEEGELIEATEEELDEFYESAEALRNEDDVLEAAAEAGYSVQEITFDADTTTIDASIIEAADELKKGECTEVIESYDGFYVAQLTSLSDAEATEAKVASIISQREVDLYAETIETWIEEANVSVVNSVWKKISFEDLGVTIYQEPVEETEELFEIEGAELLEEADEEAEEVEVGLEVEEAE